MRTILAAIAILIVSSPAVAGTMTIDVPGDVESTTATYECAGSRIEVEYINAGDNALAVVRLAQGPVIMANVLSASGARYAGQQYIWWTKGDGADLYDLTKGEDAEPVSCTSAAG